MTQNTTPTSPTQVRPQVRPERVGPGTSDQSDPTAPLLRRGGLSDPSAGHPTKSDPDPDPTTRHTPQFNPGTTWLITDRTKPAWIAALDLLDDGEWHEVTDVHDVMWRAAELAPRTIEHHLRSASRRGWITRRRKRIRLVNRELIEAGLDHTDPTPGGTR